MMWFTFMLIFSAILHITTTTELYTELPDDIPPNATHLNLNFQRLGEGSGNFSGLTGLPLEAIEMAGNNLILFPDFGVVGSTLIEIIVYYNMIERVPAGTLDGLFVLEKLDLGRNHLATFPNLTAVGNTLIDLHIFSNRLETVTSSDVAPLVKLRFLDISTNYRLVSVDLSPLGPTLTKLWLNGNTLLHFELRDFPVLRDLRFIYSALQTFPDLSSSFSSLWLLAADGNRFTDINSSSLEGCTAMTILFLRRNKLSSVPNITAMGTTLKALYLDQNQISHADPSITKSLTSLQGVSLHINLLNAVPDFTASGSTLEILTLYSNQISSIDQSLLRSLIHLTTLDLHDNPLVTVPDVTTLLHLQHLSLSETNISAVSPRVAVHLGKLLSVDLTFTQLVEIPTICPESSLTLKLENNTNLDLCSSNMAWLKQTFFTVTYTDVMCDNLGKMWSSANFKELLASYPAPQPGDVRQMLTGGALQDTLCRWPTSGILQLASPNVKTCSVACLNALGCYSFSFHQDNGWRALVVPTAGPENPLTMDNSGWEFYAPGQSGLK